MAEFERVYRDEIEHVYAFFGYRLGSRGEVEDLTQATFERALRAWDRFDDSLATPRTWLLTIAHRLLIDHFRRAGRGQHEPLETIEDSSHVAAEPRTDPGLDPELEDALGELSNRERSLIALRYAGDLTTGEIAEVTGLTRANVQQILSRCLRRLKARLDEMDDTTSGRDRSNHSAGPEGTDVNDA